MIPKIKTVIEAPDACIRKNINVRTSLLGRTIYPSFAHEMTQGTYILSSTAALLIPGIKSYLASGQYVTM
jgi:hypothetical protein